MGVGVTVAAALVALVGGGAAFFFRSQRDSARQVADALRARTRDAETGRAMDKATFTAKENRLEATIRVLRVDLETYRRRLADLARGNPEFARELLRAAAARAGGPVAGLAEAATDSLPNGGTRSGN